MNDQYSHKSPSYNKRPLWHWVVIYLVVGLAVYGLIYYFVFSKNNSSGGYVTSSNQPVPTATSTPEATVEPTLSEQPTTSAAPAIASSQTVTISNFSFQPAALNVPVGTTVKFVNNDSTAHTVTSDDGSFDSGIIPQGKSFSFTFSKTGTFTYHCAIHLSMKGTIAVQ